MKKADQFQNDTVAPSQIKASPFNPRKTFEDLDSLADSIRSKGVLVPLLVRPVGDKAEFVDGEWVGWDHLEIVDGERLPMDDKPESVRGQIGEALAEFVEGLAMIEATRVGNRIADHLEVKPAAKGKAKKAKAGATS